MHIDMTMAETEGQAIFMTVYYYQQAKSVSSTREAKTGFKNILPTDHAD
jgi:hypothetical protein